MKNLISLVIVFLLSGCGMPPGTVCDDEDELSQFFCEASKHYYPDWQYEESGAFYVTNDPADEIRTRVNLENALVEGARASKRIDIGGIEPIATKNSLLAVLDNLAESKINLEGLHVVYLGPESQAQEVLYALKSSGAKAKFVIFESK